MKNGVSGHLGGSGAEDFHIESFDCSEKVVGFRCTRGEFRSYLSGELIRREQNAGITRCFVLRDSNRIIGYITLLADRLWTASASQLLLNEDVLRTSFPAVKIGLLAVDSRHQGKGVARKLVAWSIALVLEEIAPKLGVRFMTVDALVDPETSYDATGLYERLGFTHVDMSDESPPTDGFRTMYIDLRAF
ncbi:MAG: GNAT family N-acetyltransferase [Candidatus Kapabacteria bacterium]|nr:GNAT family N-acetyltransferase [Candidatus Kapabacteria bacterium]